MSSAETTHPIEWRDEADSQTAYVNGEATAHIWPSIPRDGEWAIGWSDVESPVSYQPTASAARSFVEKSVKEAGHGDNLPSAEGGRG